MQGPNPRDSAGTAPRREELAVESPVRDSKNRPLRVAMDWDVPRASSHQALLVWVPIAIAIGLILRSAWVSDDAYITLRTIDNWLHGAGLRWNASERVQAYTHPLWMFALTLVYAVLGNDFAATVALGVLTTLASLLVLRKLASSPGHAVAAILLLACSRTFVDYATSGLENPLSQLLLACFIAAYVARADVLRSTLLSSLIALNRSDAVLLVLPALAHTCWLAIQAQGARRTLRALLLGASPFLAWEAFSLFYYGSFVPNTALAKLNTGISKLEMLIQGVVYIKDALAWDRPLLPIVAVGIGLALATRQLRPTLLAVGTILYLLYVVRIGGDFMQCRFLSLPLFAAVCLLASSDLPLEQPANVAILGAAMALLFVHPNATEAWPVGSMHHDGIADERAYYRETSSFMMWTRTGRVPRHGWTDVGIRLRALPREERVLDYGNVGYVGFASGPSVHIVDHYALTDPLLARLPARYDPFWRSGHFERQVPKGYVASVESGRCEMEDHDLCEYYSRLREVVSGDLWSWSRFVAIVALNLGQYDHLIDYERYRYPYRLELKFEELDGFVAEGAGWNSRGMRVMNATGVLVHLSSPSHIAQLQLSLDGNDDYVIEFRRGGETLGSAVSPSLRQVGAHTRTVDIDERAVKQGWDRIFIRPSNGDNGYSVGYLRLCL